ncbi:zinc finger MYM-type protein 1-like [Phymastichus coffea]|uniref:zinc finger MYM-type protein 1-like n=1 Tax=Phymastichus coffea TaxID=108790 RepID=UPI00273BD3F6|nr:zinc finger MYM-type protein 1-like [Phymastichus coffea]
MKFRKSCKSVAITKVEEEEANRVLVQNVGDKKEGANKVGALRNVENVDDLKGEINEIKVASQTIDGPASCEHALQDNSNTVQGNVKPNENTKNYSTDPALWNLDNDLVNYWLRKGADFGRNNDGKFKKSAREYIDSEGKVKIRTLQPSLFQCELKNGQIIERDWLIYSPSNGCVYCFICRLFSNHQSSQFSSVGFNDWKNGIRRVIEHNGGSEHKECLNIYGKRKNTVGCIDNQICQQAEKEFAYWKELVGHLVKAIKFLASRGLAFRGKNQTIGSKKNGNYLGLLELMGDYSPFIKDHLKKYGNKGHGHTSYLSANICEELIELMGIKVFEYILNELRQAKYYSISVDSTPDNTKRDQLSFTVRYVNEKGPIERFLKFISIESHKSEYLTNTVFGFLDENSVTLGDCRGQSYDNATNMSGQYTGLQARIKEANKYAEYCPCAGHFLNLVGFSAAQCSTNRWQKLKEALDVLETVLKVLKSLSETRWSARVDAVSAVYHAYDTILLVLDELAKDDTAKSEVQVEAAIWYDILSKIHATNLTLQKANVDLGVVVSLLESLEQYIGGLREKFDIFLESAKVFA